MSFPFSSEPTDQLLGRYLFGLAVLSLFLAMYAVQKSNHPDANVAEQYAEYLPVIFGIRIKISDFLLVLFTAFLWLATRRLVLDARSASQKQQKAYLGIGLTEIEFGEDKILARIHIKNFGLTPAYNFISMIYLQTALQEEIISKLERFDRILLLMKHLNLPPGGVSVSHPEVSADKEMQYLIATGKATVYARGYYAYRDAFGELAIESVEMASSGIRPFTFRSTDP